MQRCQFRSGRSFYTVLVTGSVFGDASPFSSGRLTTPASIPAHFRRALSSDIRILPYCEHGPFIREELHDSLFEVIRWDLEERKNKFFCETAHHKIYEFSGATWSGFLKRDTAVQFANAFWAVWAAQGDYLLVSTALERRQTTPQTLAGWLSALQMRGKHVWCMFQILTYHFKVCKWFLFWCCPKNLTSCNSHMFSRMLSIACCVCRCMLPSAGLILEYQRKSSSFFFLPTELLKSLSCQISHRNATK